MEHGRIEATENEIVCEYNAASLLTLDRGLCQNVATHDLVRLARAIEDASEALAAVAEPGVSFLTFELRQAQATHALGLPVTTA